jgi:4-hydroxy-3-methylbut-2-enyl diphosphate reductase
MIVVGSRNSSNSLRLVEVAERAGCRQAMLVDRASEIDWARSGIRTLGISAGASAPETLVDEVVEALRSASTSRSRPAARSASIVFNLPRDCGRFGRRLVRLDAW